MARDGGRGRGDRDARRGNSGPYAGASGEAGPVDIAAVRRDDALIDAISGGGPVRTDSNEEYQLAAMLAEWRTEIVERPLPEALDLDVIVAAVNQEIGARQVRVGAQSRGHLRLVRPLLAGAAAVAVIFGALTAFSYNAEPGNPLWRVKEVVFSEQAQSTVVNRAGDQIDQAQQLLAQENPAAAKAQLEAAYANVDQISDPGKRAELEETWKRLLAVLSDQAPELGKQLEAITRSVDPATSPGSVGNTAPGVPTTPGSRPASETTPNPDVLQAPTIGGGDSSQAPGTQQPTVPGQPGTTAPPVIQEPPTQAPPTQEPPTQAPPTQEPPTQEPPTQAPPTTVNSPSVPVPTRAEVPTQAPPTQAPGFSLPSIPLPIPGQPS